MRSAVALLLAVACGASGLARAEVVEARPDGFLVTISMQTKASPSAVYEMLVKPQKWWSGEYTWSGDPARLSLVPEAGGCWCERWEQGTAEHGRVRMALPGRMLRLDMVPGPLQDLPLRGVLTWWIRDGEDEVAPTALDLEYRIGGPDWAGLDEAAADVDTMFSKQVERLHRLLETGNPEPPADPRPDDGETSYERAAAAAERAAIIEQWRAAMEQELSGKPKAAPVPVPPRE